MERQADKCRLLAEELIAIFGNVTNAIEYQENKVKSLQVEEFKNNHNTIILRILKRFKLEKEREN